MPLRAIVDNEEIISSFLTKEEWVELTRKVKLNSLDVIICDTDRKGVLKINKNGTQYFAHKRGEKPENWKPENIKIIDIKNQVLLGCNDAGWNSISEYIYTDLYIDIVATKNQHKVGFKIELTSSKLSEIENLQEKYKANDIRVCWLFKKPPKEITNYDDSIQANKEIPSFKLIENEQKQLKVQLNQHNLNIREFISSLLSRKIKFAPELKAKEAQEIEVHFFKHICYNCGENQHAYFIEETLQSICGIEIYIGNSMWNSDSLKYHPNIVNSVLNYEKSEHGSHLKIGEIKERYSRTTRSSYMSFGCYKCDALFGDWYLQEDIREAKLYGSEEIIYVEIESIDLKDHSFHWCYSETKNYCNQ
ncbi:hypothetical protein U8527_09780 [Kordia algicida OT-1]|uniref:Uncharacterized protein n=1 Tax=Kordia algicida OT-1 TaxID=391587 RepID=A9DV89_9FLAO|nr:hypothetical protein [Kordia algicida]EDP96389.1 hypothetical protein KAOT1_03232 [Kordia algicida OT-1]